MEVKGDAMTSERKLGRGLEALLPARQPESVAGAAGPLWVPVEQLTPNRTQPRQDAERGLKSLAESILRHGVVQPILVSPLGPGRYEILAGERRWRAAMLAGLKAVPVVLREGPIEDQGRLEVALVENIQREDLNPIERAKACAELMERHQLTQEQVAERLGYDRSTVANLVRLLELPAGLQEAVSRGTLSAGHARALLRLNGHPLQASFAERMIREGWSVRQAEEACGKQAEGRSGALHAARPRQPAWVRELQERVARSLGLRAEVRLLRKGGGRLVIYFEDLEQLDGFARRLQIPGEEQELLGST